MVDRRRRIFQVLPSSRDQMISQFFILSPRGDTIVARDYLGNVPKVNKRRRDKEKEKRKRRGESDVALSVVLLLAPGVLSWFPLSPPPARARSARDQADDSNFSPPVTHTHTHKKKKNWNRTLPRSSSGAPAPLPPRPRRRPRRCSRQTRRWPRPLPPSPAAGCTSCTSRTAPRASSSSPRPGRGE